MSDSEDNVLNLCTKKARMSLVANADGSGDDQVTQCHVISNQLGMIYDILLDEVSRTFDAFFVKPEGPVQKKKS